MFKMLLLDFVDKVEYTKLLLAITFFLAESKKLQPADNSRPSNALRISLVACGPFSALLQQICSLSEGF